MRSASRLIPGARWCGKLIGRYLQPWIAREEGLLELGAGYGEFSREIGASPKWALEQNGPW